MPFPNPPDHKKIKKSRKKKKTTTAEREISAAGSMIVYPILQVIRQQARKHGHRKFERTASPQMLAQPADGTGQVFLDGRLGDAQPRGDFAVFQPFEAAHPENLAAAVGQRVDSLLHLALQLLVRQGCSASLKKS